MSVTLPPPPQPDPAQAVPASEPESLAPGARRSRTVMVAATAGGVLLAAVAVWVVAGTGAEWVLHHLDGLKYKDLRGKDWADALNAIRGQALAIVTGILASVAIYYTAANARTARGALAHAEESARRSHDLAVRTAERTAALTEQGQVTDRYTKAIEQLGSGNLDIRLGGIYALERIARDSARDHPTVMEVLAAFVREHSHDGDANAPATEDELDNDPDAVGRFRPDLQAALTVIGRRDTTRDSERLDLSNAKLINVDLSGARLTDAFLFGADLTWALLLDAKLTRADLTDADLTRADLTDADLTGACLNHAKLIHVDLSDADLTGTNLVEADLTNALLFKADLTHADLAGAKLTSAHLDGANLTEAKLREAISIRVDLTGAVLTDALLLRADLTGADLIDADLTRADLTGARLSESGLLPSSADLTGADLSEAVGANLAGAKGAPKVLPPPLPDASQ